MKSIFRMNQFILKLILLMFLFSCSNENIKEEYYVIKDISKNNKKNDSLTTFYPIFYGKHNFILIDSSKIYYHEYNAIVGCGTGLDSSKPRRLYLSPDSLIEIQFKDLEKFLINKLILKDDLSEKTIVTVSSPTDTIKNRALTILTKHFESKRNILVGIRRCTEEEEYVGYAKLTKTEYKPYLIKWKIGFDHDVKPNQIIEFMPSKKEKATK